jgi:hypothetical protein
VLDYTKWRYPRVTLAPKEGPVLPKADKTVACDDCNESFTYTARSQRLAAELGFETPRRCRPCQSRLHESRLTGASV